MVALPSTSSPSGSGRYNTSVCPGATPLSGVRSRTASSSPANSATASTASPCARTWTAHSTGPAGTTPAVKTGCCPVSRHTSRSAAEPTITVPLSALADGETVHTVMGGQHGAVLVDHRTGAHPDACAQESPGIAGRDEADVVAV